MQGALREKNKQLKSMASEINMYQAQVNQYKYEMERLTTELHMIKKNYLEHKKREQQKRDQNRVEEKMMAMQNIVPTGPVMLGGGYNTEI
mmetsp:Transcript_56815/g.123677  ORF Transcript_56815/g.123677 Transcript_56815/m.123677 type:complete len:90 (+) Transcript_56815:2179-2448(+)